MKGMDKMMELMLGGMSKEERLELMGKMMEKFLAGMTVEDRQELMQAMMPKMMEGVNMMELMPKMMAGMMGQGGGSGMPGMMKAMMGSEGGEQMEMGKMMTEMMPMCLNMMLPRLPKKEREDFALRLFAVLADKTCGGMSDEERRQFRESVLAVIYNS